jgi:hypothetical protein
MPNYDWFCRPDDYQVLISFLDRLANFLMRFLDNVHIVLNVPSSVHLEYREKVPNLY